MVLQQSLAPFLDQIRNRLKLSDLIATQTQVMRKGSAIKALCPFHNEKTPSFSIDDNRGIYHCFGCGASGDHFSFIMNTKNLEFLEACEHLADKVGIVLPKNNDSNFKANNRLIELLENACLWYQEQLQRSVGESARNYLEKRNITQISVENFRLGYAPSNGLLKFLESRGFNNDECIEAGVAIKAESGIYDRFKNRLIFPIISQKNQVIAFGGRILSKGEPKYLNSPETAVFQKRYVLYGFEKARKHMRQQAIVVEGYIDVIRLHQEGLPVAVAPLGTALTIEQLQQLWRLVPNPIVAFDGDLAGEKAAFSAITKSIPYLSSKNSLKILFLPQGEDPDSYVKTEGIEKFQKLAADALPVYEMLWQSATAEHNLENLSPEEFVSIKNSLKEVLQRIQNKDLKNAYIKQFDYLLNQLQQKSLAKTALNLKNNKSKNAPSLEKKISSEKILLVTLLNHPYLWKDVGEAFMRLEFSLPEDEQIRLQLVDYFFNNPESEQHIWPDFCEDLQKIADQTFYTRVPFAKIGYDQAIVEKGWWETYTNFSGLSSRSDQSQYVDNLKNDLTSSNWERLKALKKTQI